MLLANAPPPPAHVDYINHLHPSTQGQLTCLSTYMYEMLQATMLLHLSCVEIKVNTETKLICISRHGSTRHAACNIGAEMQVIVAFCRHLS